MVAQSADKLQRNGEKEIVRTTSLGGWVGSEVNVCKKLKLLWSANIAVNNNFFLLPVNRLVGGPLRSYAILAQGEASDLRGPRVNLRKFGFSPTHP